MSSVLVSEELEERHWHLVWDESSPRIDYIEDFYVDEIRDYVSTYEQVKKKIEQIKSITDEERNHIINHIHARVTHRENKGEAVARRAEA